MVDIELLKRLAEACDIERCADEEERDRNLNEFYSVLEPEDVATLIAENEALRSSSGFNELALLRMGFRQACEERDQLKAELERLRMQLVACGVVAMANTQESAVKARDMHPDYMSASCQDVMRAVDSEIALRTELERVRADAERYRSQFGTGAWDYHESWIGQKKDFVDAEIDAALGKGGGQNGSKTAETRASAGLEGGGHGENYGGAENGLQTAETPEIDGAEGGAE